MDIIAEIAQAHDGSLGMAYAYIDAVAKTGCNAIKFQTHIADAESSIHEPFRVKFSKQDATRKDYWKRMEFTLDQWKGLKQRCDEVGLEFISSPFSNAAVDLLEAVGVKRYKVGSGEVNNFVLLEKIAETGKPVIISSGMSSYNELDKTVAFLKARGVDFSILQCTTAYPTQPEQYGLNVIGELKSRYNVSVGFSDHSASTEACIAATALGAEILEFHVVFDKEMFGPDAKASLTMQEATQLVKAVNTIEIALKNPVDKKDNSKFDVLKSIFEKSLAVNKDLKAGSVLTFSDLETKKPKGFGILANEYEKVIGKKINKDLNQWDFLTDDDLSE
ncbi:N-acetylneuraminate synthase family protein [Mesoflavibacter sp. SCSIO 43206]|uniref:N-acetylneuraminate synthase family protein n=1 Tax=Mesoflavibacter sp. SCSIO 43206 TaxID=2779362 RepID=UPI001CA8AC25|nr:N-acetylneuraminate synthase family protein [Mesoflavibacter sp. SCSIO 43206]UAB74716.1 N-acetylneuraminate synthase family protein [Mesoflavibacter sp. SCSIO 43206]